jgi:hypothetical protein
MALEPTESTSVSHVTNDFPRTLIAYGGENVMGFAGNLEVTITGNALSDGIEDGDANGSLTIWPNPSNDVANIAFELITTERVRLEIFSAEGKLIDSIFEGEASAKTPYQFEVDVNHLAAGNYTCRLVSNNEVLTSKTLTVTK